MKLFVLKELPDGAKPGDVVEVTDDVGAVLMRPGVDAGRQATDEEQAVSSRSGSGVPRRRRTYATRELHAEA